MRTALWLLPSLFGLLLIVTPSVPEEPGASPFRFVDVTAEAGLDKALRGAFVHALAWGDFDNDGRLDIFVGTFSDRNAQAFGLKEAPRNRLFRQVEGGKFEHFPCPAIEVPARCSGAVFVDLDNDGDLDLYVTSNTLPNPAAEEHKRAAHVQLCKLYRNDGGGKFVDVSADSGVCPATLIRCRDIGVLDYDGDGLLDLLVLQDKGVLPEDRVPGVKLFRNLGGFKFEDVTRRAGLPDDLWGTGVAVADLNGDRRPDFYLGGCNRLFLSQPDNTYKEAKRDVFSQPEKELDWVSGATFGDIDLDGDLDLVTGRHHYFGPSRVHVYLNDGLKEGVPRFREVTKDLGIPALPQKAPHPEIQDFDNDGLPDLYWSAWFARGKERRPFLCKGQGVRDGLPRFLVPPIAGIKPAFSTQGKIENVPPAEGLGMIYYVNGSAVDYDGDGDLDFLCGNWPPEGSRLYRNDTPGGRWLQVRVEGTKMNRMGVGAQVRVYAAGKAGQAAALLGYQEITLNGGYSSSRPAIAHFGLGKIETVDLVVTLPSRREPVILKEVMTNRLAVIREP